MLKYATAAIAAKHLSRVGGVRIIEGHRCGRPAMTEAYPNAAETEWSYKAVNYYYQAASHLDQDLALPICTQELTSPCCEAHLSAIGYAILTVYALLDDNESEFRR
jgi:hypothetical protein